MPFSLKNILLVYYEFQRDEITPDHRKKMSKMLMLSLQLIKNIKQDFFS